MTLSFWSPRKIAFLQLLVFRVGIVFKGVRCHNFSPDFHLGVSRHNRETYLRGLSPGSRFRSPKPLGPGDLPMSNTHTPCLVPIGSSETTHVWPTRKLPTGPCLRVTALGIQEAPAAEGGLLELVQLTEIDRNTWENIESL